MIYQKSYQKNYYQPRRPVKSFQDLEVYQKALAVCVAVVKRIPLPKLPDVKSKTAAETCPASVIEKLHQAVLELPVLLASAHSIRFSYPDESVKRLEEAMLKCNLSIVYLEQYRDLGNPTTGSTGSPQAGSGLELEFFEEQIRNLLTCRMKTLHLQMSWKKFFAEKKAEDLRK